MKQQHTLQAHGQRADCDEDKGNFAKVLNANPNKRRTRPGHTRTIEGCCLKCFDGF